MKVVHKLWQPYTQMLIFDMSLYPNLYFRSEKKFNDCFHDRNHSRNASNLFL